MSVPTVYDALSVLRIEKEDAEETRKSGCVPYQEVLESVRSQIAENHSSELASAAGSVQAAGVLRALILKYSAEKLAGRSFERESLVERIYQDMTGTGILSRYLSDGEVEEINLNGYDTVEIVYADHITYLCGDEAFSTPQAARDLVRKLVRAGGAILDLQTPAADSFLGSGTRISAMIPPLVPEEMGVVASIRRQNRNGITRRQLIESGSATGDMLDFLVLCLLSGVSVGLAGGTGSGKTTDEAFLLNEYIRKSDSFDNRIVLIEDSREIVLRRQKDDGTPARVLYFCTRTQPSPVTMLDLVVHSLRFHPALIVPAEVRDAAAYEAAIAGQTGHAILTSFHADSAVDAYQRLLSMCRLARTGLSDETLLSLCVRAWPVMIFKKHLKDRSRKYMEVFEATGTQGREVQGRMLYRFEVDGTDRDGQGQINRVRGRHVRVGNPSEALRRRLRDNGAEETLLNRLFPNEETEGRTE